LETRVKTLTAFYDLEVGPVSFDFVVFLVKAEIARRAAKADRLHVVIVPFAQGVVGMFRDKRQFYDAHEMRWRLWNICIPACSLLNASVTLATDWQQADCIAAASQSQGLCWPTDWANQTLRNRHHLIGDIITSARSGAPVPQLSASEHARRAVAERNARLQLPVVTMTMRGTYLDSRNSDAHEWEAAAQHIRTKGYVVRMLRDTSTALREGHGFGELNLDLRMAEYQESFFNIQANNGSASLCWFSDRPYIMLDAGVGDSAEEWRGLFVEQGLPLGESWPWATKGKQRIVYRRATRDTIIEEFERGVG